MAQAEEQGLPKKLSKVGINMKNSPLGGMKHSKTIASKIKSVTNGNRVMRGNTGDKNVTSGKTRLNRSHHLAMKTGKAFTKSPTTKVSV